jgi:hypothetical protein
MDFLLKVNRQIFGILSFDDRFVLGKDLVVEVKRILQWGILIKVAADRHKHPCLSSRDRTRCIENMQPTVIWEKDRQLRCERQKDLKYSPPFEPGRIKMLEVLRIVANRTEVVSLKTVSRWCHLVRWHFGI